MPDPRQIASKKEALRYVVRQSRAYYFHISRFDLGSKAVLQPRAIDWFPDEPAFPRLCLAKTIVGAIWGSGAFEQKLRGEPDPEVYYIYKTNRIVAYRVPNTLIPDASLSTEHWCFRSVTAKFMRQIRVDEARKLTNQLL